jgi:hypothetical protein
MARNAKSSGRAARSDFKVNPNVVFSARERRGRALIADLASSSEAVGRLGLSL